MLVYGVGRQTGKKNDKFENALIENERLLETILQKRNVKDTYTTVNFNTISSIVLDTNPVFMMLKSEIENFNKEVKEALDNKAVMPNYSWKYSLNVGLRNLLKEIVVTEDRGLKVLFLEKAKAWYYDRMEKKGEIELPRPGTNQSNTRPFTANTRPFTANTRPFTSQTNRGSDQNSINVSVLPHEMDSVMKEKSFFENTARDEYLPSKIRAEILRDYDDGARTKHDSVEPPYERLSEYERKIPQGILKPSSRIGHRPQTSKTTTFAKNANANNVNNFFLDKTNQASILGNNLAEEELSHAGGSQIGNGEEGEEGDGIEGEEGEGEGGVVPQVDPNEPRKPGIVQPKKKLYMNDKITSLGHNTKDLHIGMESRSNYAHYVPSNSLAELQLEQRWRNAMHKKTIEKREKQEFETMMKDWAHTKSRLEEEIHRRNESLTFGSRYKQRTFIPRSKSANLTISKKFTSEMDKTPAAAQVQTQEEEEEEDDLGIRDEDEISEQDEEESPADLLDTIGASKITVYRETGAKKAGRPELYDFTKVRPKSVATGQEVGILKTEPIEDKMNKDKIARITRLHSALIFGTRNVPTDVGQDGAYQVDRPKSLSVYDQEKVLKYRPFSAVHQVAKPETFRKSQMEEIEEIKAKLAKFKIKVPVKQLKTSLLLPEVSKANSLSKLPNPGASLMINPFFKEKKGKKKKGSKKKR